MKLTKGYRESKILNVILEPVSKPIHSFKVRYLDGFRMGSFVHPVAPVKLDALESITVISSSSFPIIMAVVDMENDRFEWKEIWKNDYLKPIAAFYNTDGGRLLIGRTDAGEYVGVKDPKGTAKSISDTVMNKMHFPVFVTIENIGGKDCIVVDVPSGNRMADLDGKFYVRVGNTVQTLEGEDLREVLLNEKGLQWLDAPCDIGIDDLSQEAISFFVSKGKESSRIPMNVDENDILGVLNRFNLMTSGVPNLTAAILFTEDPQRYSRGAYLKIGLFDSKGSLVRESYIEGPLIMVPDKTVDKLLESYIPPRYMYDGPGVSRYNHYDYPKDALREIILNALMHMDYKRSQPVTVSVRPDELEVFCLGGLPGSMTVDKLFKKHHSVRRNEALAMVFHAAGFVEAWGQGISKVVEACEANGNKIPLFSEDQGGLSVVMIPNSIKEQSNFVKEGRTYSLDDSILRMILDDPSISAVTLATKLGVTERTIRSHLSDLRKQGVIDRTGSDKSGMWVVIKH